MKPATAVVDGAVVGHRCLPASICWPRSSPRSKARRSTIRHWWRWSARLKGANAGDSASQRHRHGWRACPTGSTRGTTCLRGCWRFRRCSRCRSAFAAEAWKARDGARLRDWVDVVGEMEALLSFAGYAFERPEDTFPEIRRAGGWRSDLRRDRRRAPADSAGHGGAATRCRSVGLEAAQAPRPSKPQAQAPSPQVLIVSGSNMAGKSTLMRTIGLNAVLALAGAPVRARACASRRSCSAPACATPTRCAKAVRASSPRCCAFARSATCSMGPAACCSCSTNC